MAARHNEDDFMFEYLDTILRVNSDAFDYTHQTEPNVPETQHHTLDYDALVAAGLDYCLMDLDDSNLQPQQGNVSVSDEVEIPPSTAPDMYDDESLHQSRDGLQCFPELEIPDLDKLLSELDDLFQT
ncbi:hypothetical protein CFO_g5051 [Ceratocystis platani]|uniref:Uncharacterized protein n=1 Tax=Ceratocystis fimbriata f. sp. platani TaxID=88771 RepID=A0A0F8CPG9_CERFI|nr:hypothetical protein CFO_g5051 [Ceratocystis platani]